jgi:DnaJ family protein A protein 2
MRRGQAQPQTKFYDLLGIAPTASDNDIKKAFRTQAMRLHPDKNKAPGAAEQFKELNAAYEILSDPEKRELYDKYGEDAFKEGGPGFAGDDILSHIFPGRGRQHGRPKSEDTVHRHSVTLEDLYNGNIFQVPIPKTVVCATCTGSGMKRGASTVKCRSCNGHGVRMVQRWIGLGMMTQFPAPCDDCDGKGQSANPRDLCAGCDGRKVTNDIKVCELFVDKGAPSNHKVLFRGDGDEAPGTSPGDVIIVLELQPHATFKRDGNNLLMQKDITLYEALCGFSFGITHLDKRGLVIKSNPGEVVRPGDIRVIEEEGMPVHKRPFEKGHLIIKFNVVFPVDGSITPDAMPLLAQALGKPKPTMKPTPDAEDVTLVRITEQHEQSANTKSNGAAYDSDDDDEGGGHGPTVQCAHQ